MMATSVAICGGERSSSRLELCDVPTESRRRRPRGAAGRQNLNAKPTMGPCVITSYLKRVVFSPVL